MVAMRDGIRLATDIYLPAADGKALAGAFPAILERTPYDKCAPSRSERSVANPVPMERGRGGGIFHGERLRFRLSGIAEAHIAQKGASRNIFLKARMASIPSSGSRRSLGAMGR